MKKGILIIAIVLKVTIGYGQLGWLQMPDYPGNGLKGLVSFSVDGKGYMGLGFDSTATEQNDFYEYDPGTNTWTQKASLQGGGRWASASIVINNKCYVVAGENGVPLNEVWEYDPMTDVWTAKADFPMVREALTGFAIGNKGYVGTGYAGGNSYTDFYEFDPVADTWTQKATFPGIPRNGAVAFSIGSKGYLGLGNANQSVSHPTDFYEYDPAMDTWTMKASSPHKLSSATYYSTGSAGYVLCGYFYQFGNTISHNPMNMIYKYDPSTDSWTLSGTFPGYPRGFAAGFILGNDMYIGTGGQKNLVGDGFRDFWKLQDGLVLKTPLITDVGSFSFAPQPVTDYLNFIFSTDDNEPVSIRIYNSMGQLIDNLNIKGQKEIDVRRLSTGIYFVELVTKKGVLDGKFIKL